MRKSTLLKKLGENIRVYRRLHGLTQEELAYKVNVSKNFIACLEKGKYFLTADTLVNLCNTLNCKVSDLFNF